MKKDVIVRRVAASERGFTLIELMISVVIGIIVTAAVISMFITTLISSTANLRMIRLNQNLRAVLSLMVQDIRRSGYLYGTTVAYPASGAPVPGTTWDAGAGAYVPQPQIEFRYDLLNSGGGDYGLGTADNFGYQWQGGTNPIEMKNQSASWEPITDPEELEITGFAIDVFCENVKDPADVDCTADGVYVRTVEITISATHADDPAITRTVTERVRIRNDQLVKS